MIKHTFLIAHCSVSYESRKIFLLTIYLNSVWYYASSVFVFFFDLRPLFTLQIFHACLAFSRVVNHAALSSSFIDVLPPQGTWSLSLYWCLIACLFLRSQTGFLKTVQHRVKARHLSNTEKDIGQRLWSAAKSTLALGRMAWQTD